MAVVMQVADNERGVVQNDGDEVDNIAKAIELLNRWSRLSSAVAGYLISN